jgi:hypothetical protein
VKFTQLHLQLVPFLPATMESVRFEAISEVWLSILLPWYCLTGLMVPDILKKHIQYIWNHSSYDEVSHPRRLESSPDVINRQVMKFFCFKFTISLLFFYMKEVLFPSWCLMCWLQHCTGRKQHCPPVEHINMTMFVYLLCGLLLLRSLLSPMYERHCLVSL